MASQGELEHPKKRFSSILRSLPALATPIGIQPI
jgi:hypothetical protein